MSPMVVVLSMKNIGKSNTLETLFYLQAGRKFLLVSWYRMFGKYVKTFKEFSLKLAALLCLISGGQRMHTIRLIIWNILGMLENKVYSNHSKDKTKLTRKSYLSFGVLKPILKKQNSMLLLIWKDILNSQKN